MKSIPDNIKSARLINSATGKEITLSTKPGSCCHFAGRIPYAKHEIGLRIDWSDMDASGDPTLDADFFNPGDTKPLKEPQFSKAHHTNKTLKNGIWTYEFSFDGLRLKLLLELTREQSIKGCSCIASPVLHSKTEWIQQTKLAVFALALFGYVLLLMEGLSTGLGVHRNPTYCWIAAAFALLALVVASRAQRWVALAALLFAILGSVYACHANAMWREKLKRVQRQESRPDGSSASPDQLNGK